MRWLLCCSRGFASSHMVHVTQEWLFENFHHHTILPTWGPLALLIWIHSSIVWGGGGVVVVVASQYQGWLLLWICWPTWELSQSGMQLLPRPCWFYWISFFCLSKLNKCIFSFLFNIFSLYKKFFIITCHNLFINSKDYIWRFFFFFF